MAAALNRGAWGTTRACAPLLVTLLLPATVNATHVSTATDVARLRTTMSMEGFLNFVRPGGEERTGWTDIRHPGNDGTSFRDPATGTRLNTLVDRGLGYDRSDNTVKVSNKVVTLDAPPPPGGLPPGAPTPEERAAAQIARDFDFANEAYAQAGISVLNVDTRDVDHSTGNAAGNVVVEAPVRIGRPIPDEQDAIQAQNRFGATPAAPQGTTTVVNNWYATRDSDGDRGITAPHANNTNASSGTMIFDGAVNDTFAHELGHFLLDNHRFDGWQGVFANAAIPNFTLTFGGQTTAAIANTATPADVQAALEALPNIAPGQVTVTGGTDAGTYVVRFSGIAGTITAAGAAVSNETRGAHSGTPTDLMAAGSIRAVPGAAVKGDGNNAPREPGRANGPLGSTNHLDETVKAGGAGADLQQIQALHAGPYVQGDDNDHAHGDRADFDWVEDNIFLEPTDVSNADNHPGAAPDPADFLVWEIADINASDHVHERTDGNIAHDHDAWGALGLNAFSRIAGNTFFRTIDIVSQIARYADMDIKGNNWSRRESALDFRGGNDSLLPEFSVNGIDWVSGLLINVFTLGWTQASLAEDFVSRWRSPVEARFVRLKALTTNGHDGNAQIDAIIASRVLVNTVPAPATALLVGLVWLALLPIGRRRRA